MRSRSSASCWRAKGFRHFAEEVVAFVVDDDERGKVADLDLPDRFHSELRILEHLDLGDAVLRESRRGTADRTEIEAPVFLARIGHRARAIAFREHHER